MRFWTKVLTGIGVVVLSTATGTLGRHGFGAAASVMPTVRDTATLPAEAPVSGPVPLRLRIGTFDPLLNHPRCRRRCSAALRQELRHCSWCNSRVPFRTDGMPHC